ncbi:MAG: hypothetical protein KDJ50_06595 [Alphaproteobacteria bacterium]|nr:hypothetical protein [Alphaproteobacteria bacterium]
MTRRKTKTPDRILQDFAHHFLCAVNDQTENRLFTDNPSYMEKGIDAPAKLAMFLSIAWGNHIGQYAPTLEIQDQICAKALKKMGSTNHKDIQTLLHKHRMIKIATMIERVKRKEATEALKEARLHQQPRVA